MDLSAGKKYWDKVYQSITYPSLEEDIEVDVLIIGSGSSGAHCAYFLSQSDLKVALVDKRKGCSGSTAANTGLLQYSNDKMLFKMINSFGEKAGVRHYQLCYDAIQTLQNKVVPSLHDTPDFVIRSSFYYASELNDVPDLEQEYAALKENGFPVHYITEKEMKNFVSFIKPAAIITENDAEINPYKHAHLLLQYANQHKVKIYENTKINGRKKDPHHNILYTDKGYCIKATYVINATGYEMQEEAVDSNAYISSSYAITTNVINELEGWHDSMLIWETARPYLYARRTADNRIIFGGLDEPTTIVRQRDSMLIHKRDVLLEKLIELFPELENKVTAPFYWGAFFGETHNGLPSINVYEEYRNCFFLRGYGGNGTVSSVVLSQIIRDLIVKGKNEDAYIYLSENK